MGMQIIPASLGDCDNGGEGWARIPGELSIPYRELATVVTLQHLAGMLCLITGGMISCVPVIAPVRATFSSSPFFFFNITGSLFWVTAMVQVSGDLHGLKPKQQYYHSHLSIERWPQSGLKSQARDAARGAGFRSWQHSSAHHRSKYPVKECRWKRKSIKTLHSAFPPRPSSQPCSWVWAHLSEVELAQTQLDLLVSWLPAIPTTGSLWNHRLVSALKGLCSPLSHVSGSPGAGPLVIYFMITLCLVASTRLLLC